MTLWAVFFDLIHVRRRYTLKILACCANISAYKFTHGNDVCAIFSQQEPRQVWSFSNETLGGQNASNIVCGDADHYILNCPGINSDCHAWGASFNDRNGVLFLNGTASAFVVASWPDTKSLPVGNGQTPPGMCLHADTPGSAGTGMQMKPCGSPGTLVFQVVGKMIKDVRSGLCLDIDAPPLPPFVGVTCETAPFSSAAYCNKSLSTADRVASIVSLMTTREKLKWLESSNGGCPRLGLRNMQFGEG